MCLLISLYFRARGKCLYRSNCVVTSSVKGLVQFHLYVDTYKLGESSCTLTIVQCCVLGIFLALTLELDEKLSKIGWG